MQTRRKGFRETRRRLLAKGGGGGAGGSRRTFSQAVETRAGQMVSGNMVKVEKAVWKRLGRGRKKAWLDGERERGEGGEGGPENVCGRRSQKGLVRR